MQSARDFRADVTDPLHDKVIKKYRHTNFLDSSKKKNRSSTRAPRREGNGH